VIDSYRRILVPVAANPDSIRAVVVACRLAAEHRASLTVVTVVEIPALLPLDADMPDEEAAAHGLLRDADAVAESHGLRVSTRLVRARTAGGAIVERAVAMDADLVVVGAVRHPVLGSRTPIFGRTVKQVLEQAPCRVFVIAPSRELAVTA
jgi:nucleotide-binding universal stress UspA family protein